MRPSFTWKSPDAVCFVVISRQSSTQRSNFSGAVCPRWTMAAKAMSEPVVEIPPAAEIVHALPHVFRLPGVDGGDHRHPRRRPSAEEVADRQARGLAEQIPAGHVDGRFGVVATL
jgi:hypothetical protein